MNKFCSLVFIVVLYAVGYWCAEIIRQERAKVVYVNPKYMKDVVAFTARKSRHSPYLTNLTATLLKPYSNNVSLAIKIELKSGGDFRVVAKICDSFKNKWMREFVQQYTNVSLDKCPVPAQRVGYMNMELPPKNMPFPMVQGDYYIWFEIFITATKEKILDCVTGFHVEQNQRKPKKG